MSISVYPQGTLARPFAGTDRHALVRAWLVVVALMVFAMVVVGGATRLTNSGLSITEWQPLLGAIPPLSADDWAQAFAKYKAIPQGRQNAGMSLAEFQFIYWWEWAHRFLGRMIGVAYAVPFAIFLWRGMIPSGQTGRFVLLLLLGGLQGAVGWWMVASGLEARVDVAPYRLALHLTLACVIFAGLVWTAASLEAGAARRPETARMRLGAALLVGLVFLQIFLGALVAGNDAGLVYNTWPDMNGHVLPPEAFALRPLWHNLFEDHATVQFVHRTGAYVLLIAALWHALAATVDAGAGRVRTGAWVLLALVVGQAAIGIATLLLAVPLHLALAHQGMAVIVLAAAVLHLRAVYHPA